MKKSLLLLLFLTGCGSSIVKVEDPHPVLSDSCAISEETDVMTVPEMMSIVPDAEMSVPVTAGSSYVKIKRKYNDKGHIIEEEIIKVEDDPIVPVIPQEVSVPPAHEPEKLVERSSKMIASLGGLLAALATAYAGFKKFRKETMIEV